MKKKLKDLSSTIILGAGVTGLAAGIKTKAPIYEATFCHGGICRSYIKNAYRFEVSGGHWLFGDDREVFSFINSLSPLKFYRRNSAVFFPKENLYVPYPLQNHLSLLPQKIAKQYPPPRSSTGWRTAVEGFDRNFCRIGVEKRTTFADWLLTNFGEGLCRLFFFPFHKLYTAGLYTQVAPQDKFKTPLQPTKGYNATFSYPQKGLGSLIEKMAEKCQVNYHRKVTKIDIKQKEVAFENGSRLKYERIISTLPLNKMIRFTDMELKEAPPPYTSVVVVNIGARKGKKCPPHHWLYIPESKSGFYRIGFYSNIDYFFLPPQQKEKVSLYVEKAYLGGQKPTPKEIEKLCRSIAEELISWQFISEVDVVHPTWIETAYTYLWPGSAWREKAIRALEKANICQIGRYGRWQFQGILDSIKEGLGFRV